LQGFFLSADVYFGVAIGRIQASMPEPRADHVYLNPGFQKVNGCGVAQNMRRDRQCFAIGFCFSDRLLGNQGAGYGNLRRKGEP
jgi:hypothetical protein